MDKLRSSELQGKEDSKLCEVYSKDSISKNKMQIINDIVEKAMKS